MLPRSAIPTASATQSIAIGRLRECSRPRFVIHAFGRGVRRRDRRPCSGARARESWACASRCSSRRRSWARSVPASSSGRTPFRPSTPWASASAPARRAVYTERLTLRDAVDGSEIANVPLGDAFRARFGNPYAVIHRADIHPVAAGRRAGEWPDRARDFHPRRADRAEPATGWPSSISAGARSRPTRSSDATAASRPCASNTSATTRGIRPRRLPRRGRRSGISGRSQGERPGRVVRPQLPPGALPGCAAARSTTSSSPFTVVRPRTWSITEGSQEEVLSYFTGIVPRARQLLSLPKSWRRWATADREPIAQWTFGRATLARRRGASDAAIPRAGGVHGARGQRHAGRSRARK